MSNGFKLESDFITFIKKTVSPHLCIKIHGGSYQQDLPDLIILTGRTTHFVEVKNRDNKPTKSQLEMLQTIHKSGGIAYWLTCSFNGIITAYSCKNVFIQNFGRKEFNIDSLHMIEKNV